MAGMLLPFFQKETGMTFKEFNTLKAATASYNTLPEVKTALAALRAGGGGGQPAAPPPPVVVLPPPPLPGTWTQSAAGPLQLFRAVNEPPGKIKHKRRWSPRVNPKLKLAQAISDLLRSPRGFAEGHVRANYDFVHSAAQDETCAGYQSTRDYVYSINVPAMYRYDPPGGGSNVERPPIIWANSASRSLAGATLVAFDPRKVTLEVDLMFDVELSMIDRYKPKGGVWTPIDWNTIVAIVG
jgi:hypothetical protein